MELSSSGGEGGLETSEPTQRVGDPRAAHHMEGAKTPGPFDEPAPARYLVASVDDFDGCGIYRLEIFRVAVGDGVYHESPQIRKAYTASARAAAVR